jgi:UDP-glucose 4-epimerase
MRILVTGGAGFIGSHIVARYLGRGCEVRVLDNLRTGRLSNLEGLACEVVHGSVTDPAVVREAVRGMDLVFHMAALVSVPESVERPLECVEINVNGLLHVLEAAVEAGVRKVVFASSAAVYGDSPEVPKTETMLPEPRSPYAVTKLDGEHYLAMYRREHGLATAALRFFNVFGPRQDPKGAYAAAVPIFIERALRGEDIVIYGDGGQTRDFIHVEDIVGALAFAAETPELGGVFNAGYGAQITINDLAERIIALTGSSSRVVRQPPRAGDVRHSRASPAKLLSAGWQPQWNLEEGLRRTIEDCRAGA